MAALVDILHGRVLKKRMVNTEVSEDEEDREVESVDVVVAGISSIQNQLKTKGSQW